MTPQSVASLAAGHGLGAGGAFGAARSEVQDRFSPMADPLLYKVIDRIDLHPLRTPAEDAVGRRIATSKEVDPKGFFDQRRQHRAVLAAAEADQPGPIVFHIELTERNLNLLKRGHGYGRDYMPNSGLCCRISIKEFLGD